MPVPDHSANALMAAADIAGIIRTVALEIVIDGNVFYHYESFHLEQSVSSHHAFRLVLQHDILAAAQGHALEDARHFLGRRLSVTFKYKGLLRGGPEREFIGTITGVAFSGQHGSRGSIVLTGKSPTTLLDGAVHTQSFGGEYPVSLAYIANTAMRQCLGDTRYGMQVKPVYTGNLPYSCQYHETHYNYLARMAAAYGEWFFYDGCCLHFGKPSTFEDPIRLIYGKDTDKVELKMSALHTGMKHYGYNSNTGSALSTGDTPAASLNEAGRHAQEAGNKVFKAPSLSVAPIRALTGRDIEMTQAAAAGAAASQAFTLTGTTSVSFLYPGCLIEMNFRKPESAEVKYYSRLIITSVSHSVDAVGHYQGKFEAIPSDTQYLPAADYTMPQAQPQVATVISNANSEGRVKVQFGWQRGQATTDFIRVATPDGGGSGAVSRNRGFVFIPEQGDQVMVNFVHGHPDRPFVQSAMFHGLNGLGGFDGNHLKSITTRSGNIIQFDDTDGKGSITVKDASGNEICLDGNGNINITAPNVITMNATDIILNAAQNISASAGVNISESAGANKITSVGLMMDTRVGGNLTINVVGDSLENIQGNFESHTKERMETAKKGYSIQSSEDSIHIKAAEEIQKHSGEKSLNS